MWSVYCPCGHAHTVLEMLKLHIKNVMNLEEILDYIGTIPFQQLDVKSLEARKQKKLEEVEKCKRLKTSLYQVDKEPGGQLNISRREAV